MSEARPQQVFDVIIRGGTVFDGSGAAGYAADVAVAGDKIAAIGSLADARAGTVLDAAGLAVAPGFINMLSHSYYTLLIDPRSLSELKQGVTTQVFGEGNTPGPLNPEMRERLLRDQAPDMQHEVPWTSLAGYLQHAEHAGISQNVASYIGATSLRTYVAGFEDRPLTDLELDAVRGLVREEMSAGALGIGSSLIYPPAFFSSTEELIEMCRAAAPYGGKYISHLRNESHGLLDAVDELVRIAREGGVPAEIYHLKAGGEACWPLMAGAIERVEKARAEGLAITADMYTYRAGATGLSNSIPPWYHEGGAEQLYERLTDPAVRAAIRRDIETRTEGWENFFHGTASPENILLLQVRNPELRRFQGKTLAWAARDLGKDPIDAMMDLVLADRSRITTAYFMMSDENVSLGLSQPWVSLGSDAGSVAAEPPFILRSTHPRAYGNFVRFLAKYVRDEALVSLPEAVRRLTSLPAGNLGLDRRGRLREGYFADIAVFDAAAVADLATFEQPHQYAVGVRHVLVNGEVALRDEQFAGNLAGRALHGPGRKG